MSDQERDREARGGTTVADAARLLGISAGAVRKRVERGKLAADHDEDGRLIVYLDRDTTSTTDHDTTRDRPRPSRGDRYTRSLEEQVEYLRGQLAQEREARTEERRRQDTVIAQLSSANAEQARTIRMLEAPKPENPIREWAIDEEVARKDEGMEGRPGVSDEQKHYERYVQPYEPSESPQTVKEEPEGTSPRSSTPGPQVAPQRPQRGILQGLRRRIFGR